jgi:hypothetical protein
MNFEDPYLSIRLRREKSTYFFTCTQMETIDMLKRRLQLFHKGVELPDMRLYHGNKVILVNKAAA